MFALTLISGEIMPLKRADTCETALVFMQSWEVSHLPVVENNKVIGYVSINEVSSESKTIKIDKFIKSDKQHFVFSGQHLFEVIKVLFESSLSAIAVVNEESNYIGIISYKEVIKDIYSDSSLSQEGGIVTLEMSARDFALGELSRITEYNDVKIINVFVNTAKNTGDTILVSLKLNSNDLKNVVASFERHGKIIRSINLAAPQEEHFSNRFDWLIKYLNT